jgi:hypothetical protein
MIFYVDVCLRRPNPCFSQIACVGMPRAHTYTGKIDMKSAETQASVRNERLAYIVERCLESQAAYKLFDMLASISELDRDAKTEYMELVRDSGAYSEEEIDAIERLITSGAAGYFKQVIDQVREEHVQREIEEMLV